jgi:putative flippase GtrA
MKRPLPVWLRYAAFAALATAANLLTQWLFTALGRALWPDAMLILTVFGFMIPAGEAVFWAALAAGTAAGFLLKYLLDKNFIFHHTPPTAGAGLATIFLYGVTAVITTLIFWGVQYLFTLFGPEDFWKYAGGVCGLVPGYLVKYFLDKRFVFRKSAPRPDAPDVS